MPNKVKDFSLDEIKIIKKFDPKLVLIDRLGSVNKNFLSSLKKSKIKTVLIDNSSNLKNILIFILIHLFLKNKKRDKNQGYDYSIFPSILIKKLKT